MITFEELIIEMMPFRKELKEFCKKNKNFSEALKAIYPDRFIVLQAVNRFPPSPDYPDDEVIGFYIYDYGVKSPVFKQDFIVNIGKKNNNFVLYTGLSKVVDQKSVKHINEFLTTYGKSKHCKYDHRPRFEDFADKLKERALKAMALARKRKSAGYPKIEAEHTENIYKKFKERVASTDPRT